MLNKKQQKKWELQSLGGDMRPPSTFWFMVFDQDVKVEVNGEVWKQEQSVFFQIKGNSEAETLSACSIFIQG